MVNDHASAESLQKQDSAPSYNAELRAAIMRNMGLPGTNEQESVVGAGNTKFLAEHYRAYGMYMDMAAEHAIWKFIMNEDHVPSGEEVRAFRAGAMAIPIFYDACARMHDVSAAQRAAALEERKAAGLDNETLQKIEERTLR